MYRRIAILLVALGLLLVPGAALAQGTSTSGNDFLMRIEGPIHLTADERAGTVMVISDTATIDGTVDDTLIVISGTAIVNGRVAGDIAVFSGTLDLRDGAQVNNVTLIGSTLNQDPGATVAGTVNRQSTAAYSWARTAFAFFWWIGVTIVMLIAAVLFAALAGRQLATAGETIVRHPGASILTAIIVGIVIPILAVAAFVTVVGIPFGIALLIFLMPVLWFLGYLVSGTLLGAAIVRAIRGEVEENQRVLAALIGVFLLQVIGLIPAFGPLIGFLAGALGAGAIVFALWRTRRGAGGAEPMPRRTPAPTA